MSITISYISYPLSFYLATAGVNHHVLLWNPYVISKPVGVSMKGKSLFFLPFNFSCFFFFLFFLLFHPSPSHPPLFLLSLPYHLLSLLPLSPPFLSLSFYHSYVFFVKVLRGHMQSVISVNFIQSRGQTISLSKDKVSMS